MIVYTCINIGVIEEVTNGRTAERKENQMEHFKSNELCISEFKRFES